MNYPNQYCFQTERASRLCELIRSNLYLAIAIIMTANLGLSVISAIIARELASSIIGLALPVLTLVGVWLLRSGAMKGFRNSPFGFLKVRTISMIVILIILMVSMLIVMAFSSTIIDVFNAVAAGEDVTIQGQQVPIDSNSREQIANFMDVINTNYPDALGIIAEYGRTIIIAVCAAAIAVCVLALIAAFKANGVINKMKNTILFGYDEPIKTGYLTAMLYVFAGMMFIFTVVSFFTVRIYYYMIINQISNLLEIALIVTAALFYGKVHKIME